MGQKERINTQIQIMGFVSQCIEKADHLFSTNEFLIAKDLLDRAEKVLLTKIGCELPV